LFPFFAGLPTAKQTSDFGSPPELGGIAGHIQKGKQMSQNDNPCMTCAVDQLCCKAMGLKLSRGEYEAHFRKHSGRFEVVPYGKMMIVYPQDERPCPYLTPQGCSIYGSRPVDCRLYPYELNRIVEKRDRIEAVVYDQTDCPHKEGLFIPFEEAEALITALAEDVFGPGKPVQVRYEPGKKPRRPSGFFSALFALLSKVRRRKVSW